MSWAGFKKAINRTGTQMLMKAGYIETTTDPAYNHQVERFKALEAETFKLQKQARGYLDALRQVSGSQLEIVETVLSFYDTQGGVGDSSNSATSNATMFDRPQLLDHFLTAVQHLHLFLLTDLDDPYRNAVLDPISRFCGYFSDINEAIRKRDHKKITYDHLKAKVKRLSDKSEDTNIDHDKLVKLHKEYQDSKYNYEKINTQLKTDLPQLMNLRVSYLDPSFEAFVMTQLKYCTEAYSKLNNIQNHISTNSRHNYANGKLDEKIDNVLSRMKQLNITSVHPGLI